jgi:hypothetical protein
VIAYLLGYALGLPIGLWLGVRTERLAVGAATATDAADVETAVTDLWWSCKTCGQSHGAARDGRRHEAAALTRDGGRP